MSSSPHIFKAVPHWHPLLTWGQSAPCVFPTLTTAPHSTLETVVSFVLPSSPNYFSNDKNPKKYRWPLIPYKYISVFAYFLISSHILLIPNPSRVSPGAKICYHQRFHLGTDSEWGHMFITSVPPLWFAPQYFSLTLLQLLLTVLTIFAFNKSHGLCSTSSQCDPSEN